MASGFHVMVNGIIIPSIEALYQACRYPLNPELQKEIIIQSSPMTAKMISKKYLDHTRPDWNEVRFDIMYWCLEVKLAQNWEKFYRVLQETGTHDIVEMSPKDKVWAAVPDNKGKLIGVNALGRLLMKLREKYVFDKTSHLECVEPLAIDHFLLLGFPIQTVLSPAFDMEEAYSVRIPEVS